MGLPRLVVAGAAACSGVCTTGVGRSAQVSAVDRDPTVVVPVMVHHLQSVDGGGFEVVGGVVAEQQRLRWCLVPVWCGWGVDPRVVPRV